MLLSIPFSDFTYLQFLLHHGVVIFIDKRLKYVSAKIESKCKYLKRNKCAIYKTRPNICKDHAKLVCIEREFDKDVFLTIHTEKELFQHKRLIQSTLK